MTGHYRQSPFPAVLSLVPSYGGGGGQNRHAEHILHPHNDLLHVMVKVRQLKQLT